MYTLGKAAVTVSDCVKSLREQADVSLPVAVNSLFPEGSEGHT